MMQLLEISTFHLNVFVLGDLLRTEAYEYFCHQYVLAALPPNQMPDYAAFDCIFKLTGEWMFLIDRYINQCLRGEIPDSM